jgi:sulfur transfer complex TusBCD TusB component (DsrH family)
VTANASPASTGALLLAAAGLIGVSMIISVSGGPSDTRPMPIDRLPEGYGTALYVWTADEGDAGQPLTGLAAAIDLVRSSRENLAQAESLRGTAARLAQIARENVAARKNESNPAALESAQYQQVIAESQLALAEDLLARAGTMSEGAQEIFEIARQNALRLQDGGQTQEPDDFIRPDPPDVVRSVRLQAAARRNRRA